MTQPPPRPNLDAIAARVRNPGGTVGYWALKDIAVLLAYARSLETALAEITTAAHADRRPGPDGDPWWWEYTTLQLIAAKLPEYDALLADLPPGRDGT